MLSSCAGFRSQYPKSSSLSTGVHAEATFIGVDRKWSAHGQNVAMTHLGWEALLCVFFSLLGGFNDISVGEQNIL
jgi:hypothetical protein